MEELRSTEVLDKEILEDARKKALRILQTAEDTLSAHSKEWNRKTEKALNSIRKEYSVKSKKTEEEIFARLPLDFRRLRSEIAESSLQKAMESFLTLQKRENLLLILEEELSRRLKSYQKYNGSNAGQNNILEVKYSGMSEDEAGQMLTRSSGLKASLLKPSLDAANFSSNFPSIEINLSEVKITASVDEAARSLLKEKRAELASALLGEEVLND